MALRANYHTHTTFCDGSDAAEDVVLAAIDKGFSHLGFSGHMDPDIHMDFDAYLAEIGRLREKYADRIEILCGVELDNLYDPHCADGAEEIMGRLAEEFFGGDYYKLSKSYYDLVSRVYDRLHCTFVGHFDLVTRFNDSMHFLDEEDPRYRMPALEAMEYLVKEGVPFEINCGALNRNRKKELYPNMFLLKNLREFGGEILINSDAHQKELLDGGFDVAVERALACGFTHINILTRRGTGKIHFEQLALDTLTD